MQRQKKYCASFGDGSIRRIRVRFPDWLVTTPPFAIGKPFVRQPRGDTRVTPEDKRRAVAQRAAEIAERRAVFDANNNN